MVVISRIGAHVSLLFPVVAKSHSAWNSHIGKCSILVVVQQDVWGGITSYEDIRPAVSVKVARNNREAILPRWLIEVGGLGDVLKSSISHIVIENVRAAGESPRAADDGKPLELANGVTARQGNSPGIEIHVIRNCNIQPAVAIVVEE